MGWLVYIQYLPREKLIPNTSLGKNLTQYLPRKDLNPILPGPGTLLYFLLVRMTQCTGTKVYTEK